MHKYFCNCDGSIRNNTGYYSFIIKDSNNNYIATKVFEMKNCKKSHLMELSAINELMKFLIKEKYVDSDIFIYSDSLSMVNVINTPSLSQKHKYGEVIRNYNKLKSYNSVCVQWINRNENKIADALIKLPQDLNNVKNFDNEFKRMDKLSRINSMNVEKNKIININEIRNFENILNEMDNVLYYIEDVDDYQNKLYYSELLYNQALEDLDMVLNTKKLSASEISKIFKTRKEILDAKQKIIDELKLIDLIPNNFWKELSNTIQLIKEEYGNYFNDKNKNSIKLDYLDSFNDIKDILEKCEK